MWAQRGGGGHGGMSGVGSRGGYSGGGGYAAHGGGGYAYHGGGGYARVPSYAGASRAGTWSGGSRGWNGTNWNGWHGSGWNGWRGPYRPWGYGWGGYPWWGYGYAGWGGYPWWGWSGGLGGYDSGYYADNSYSAQTYPSYVYVTPSDSSDYPQSYQVQQDEIDRLNNEVDRLRAQGPAQNPASQPQGKMTEIRGETVLVYRDGHAEEIQNYAIVGKTIWVFNEARARKIPLADLDLAATKRDNEDRGIDFVVPNPAR